MAPKISSFVRAILNPNNKGRTVRSDKKKKDEVGSSSPSAAAGKPPRKPSRAPSTPLSSRTLSTCGSLMSNRSSGSFGVSSSSRSSRRSRIYSEDDDETCTSNTLCSEGYSSSSPSASPASRHRRPYPLLQRGHSDNGSFRVRRRNRALSDKDFDELITVSCGWAYDPSEEFMPEVVPTHRRSKNMALAAVDFQKFIFATSTTNTGNATYVSSSCGSHHGRHPTPNKIPVCTVQVTEARMHPLLYR